MMFLRILLLVLTIDLLVYTYFVGAEHGWNLLPVFFADIGAMGWPGQFNVDFMGFLVLSGLWTMWRNAFSVTGIGLGLLAFFGGILFLGTYLLVLSYQCADLEEILLGKSRKQA